MTFYPVCKAVVTGAAILTAALITAGCSQPNSQSQLGGTQSAAAVEATGGVAPTEAAGGTAQKADGKAGVRTNHDIYHSRSLEVPAGRPVPAVTVRVDPDRDRGWNLYVGTANFEFTSPNNIGGESSPTAGHGYLYINDKPVQRIYGSWTHLPELPAGNNEIRVTLNANSHATITTQGQPIEESVMVEVYDPTASEPN